MSLKLERLVIHRGYDRASCWVHARCGFVYNQDGSSAVVVTLQKSLMGNGEDTWDVFSGLWTMLGDDGGETWRGPVEQGGLSEWFERDGTRVVISDFTPQWHRATGTLLGIGHTVRYRDGRLMPPPRPRETAYSIFDATRQCWKERLILDMQDSDRFFSAGAGSVQWEELDNGDILLPIYFQNFGDCVASVSNAPASKVAVLRCAFNGETLRILEIGEELRTTVRRGFCEPSLIECAGKYWLTLRTGERAYVARSYDGLNFDEPQPWRFDDGGELGSADTQQHWARCGERLFLVYTRRGLNNDHVVRNRAPLAIAEVDQETCRILRDTEQIAVPNRGAQLGNFGVAQSADGSVWICVSEWMENAGRWNGGVWSALREKFSQADLSALAATPGRNGLCELGGSDNSIYLVNASVPSAKPAWREM